MPTNSSQYIFLSSSFIVGALIFTYLLGEIADLLYGLRADIKDFSSTQDSIHTAMCCLKIKDSLQVEIIDYFKSTYQIIKRNQSWDQFMYYLPNSLKENVKEIIYKDILLSQPVFAYECLGFISGLEIQFVLPSETLIEMMDESKEFYIIVEGVLDVIVEGLDQIDHTVRRLRSGDYCGEVGILYNRPRTATVFALNYCTVGVLQNCLLYTSPSPRDS